MGNNGKIDDSLTVLGTSKFVKEREPKAKSKYLKDFKNVLRNEIKKEEDNQGIEISLHAAKRIEDRNLEIDNEEFLKLRGAINKLRDKGGQESLIITDKAAYIIDVNQNRIVTAIDKDNMEENVFTKIDSTLVLN